jgi:hypothetical protein
MRRIAGVLLVCLAAAGCGGDGDSRKAAAAAARQLDPGSDVVLAIDADYGDANWQQVKRLYARAVQRDGVDFGDVTPPTLDGALNALASSAGLSFAEDVRPLLKGTLLIGVNIEPAPPLSAETRRILERVDRTRSGYNRAGEIYYDRQGHRIRDVSRRRIERALDEQSGQNPSYEFTAVFRTADAKALQKLVGKLRDQGLEAEPMPGVKGARRLAGWIALVGQDTLVATLDSNGEGDESERLLRERLTTAGKGPTAPELGDDFLAARVTPQLLGAWMDRDELARALASAPGKALRGAQARLRLDRDAGHASARVDFEGLRADQLPLPEAGELALPRGQGIASASANQSRTTVFLARLARELWPDSRFVRRVERLERKQGLRFEDEVLRQFSGPSSTVTRPRRDGGADFAARSTLRDPVAMTQLLPRLYPSLPGILEGLQGLGNTGLTGLLLVAPDAPLVPGALPALQNTAIYQQSVFELRGLSPNGIGPDRILFGVVDDDFVVASSRKLFREIAGMPTDPAPKAGTRLRIDVPRLLEQSEMESEKELRALFRTVDASASAQDGDIVADAKVTWSR